MLGGGRGRVDGGGRVWLQDGGRGRIHGGSRVRVLWGGRGGGQEDGEVGPWLRFFLMPVQRDDIDMCRRLK